MPDELILTITLRKTVLDQSAGRLIYELVKTRLEDHPEVSIKAHVSNHYSDQEPEP